MDTPYALTPFVVAVAALVVAVLLFVLAAYAVYSRLRRERHEARWLAMEADVAKAEARARHLESAGGQHQCCRLVDGEQCELWCCHPGGCTPDQVGGYLQMPPLVHPLAVLRLYFLSRLGQWRCLRCPVCDATPQEWGFGWGIELEGLVSREYDGVATRAVQREWRFWPCGCAAREIMMEVAL